MGSRFERGVILLCFLGTTVSSGGVASAQAARTNIVIIWGDDIGQSNISAYSHGVMGYKTPNIDRVAKEGMMFTTTTPSRAARPAGPRSSPVNPACELA